MKQYKYIAAAAVLALSMGFTACDDDDDLIFPEVPETPTGAVKAVGASVESGAVISADVTEISIAYDGLISLNSAVHITLNGSAAYASIWEKTLIVYVALEPGKAYTLDVPAGAVIGNKGNSYAEAYSLQFAVADPSAADYIPSLSNANATAQAQNVFNFLIEQSGKRILSGAMANVNLNNDFANWVYGASYAYPAMTCYDFIHINADWIDYSDVSLGIGQWKNNGLVGYMWHWAAPTDEAAYRAGDLDRYGFNVPGGDNPSEFDIREALKDGTWQHEFIMADIDRVAAVLKKLQDAGVPVIWRPLHEAAGSYQYNNPWFWWGRHGEEATKDLWKLMYDRLVNHHGLNNLIWVWTAQYDEGYEAQMAGGYPGNEYVDIVGVDMYENTNDAQPAAYAAALAMTEGKRMVALSETGRLQMPADCIAQGANWAWFMLWYSNPATLENPDMDGFGNTKALIREVMQSPFVINREQMPSLK